MRLDEWVILWTRSWTLEKEPGRIVLWVRMPSQPKANFLVLMDGMVVQNKRDLKIGGNLGFDVAEVIIGIALKR